MDIIHILVNDGLTSDARNPLPLKDNPFRSEETRSDVRARDLESERLRLDARRWRDPNYRMICGMTLNREGE